MKRIRKIVKSAFKSSLQLFTGIYFYQVSALSFTTLFSIVPLFIVTVYVLSIFPIFTSMFTMAKEYIFANFVPASGAVIEKYLTDFSQQAATLPITSILFLAVSVLMLIVLVKNIINDIWGSPQYQSLVDSIAHYLLVLILPIIIIIGIFLTSYLMTSHWYSLAVDYLHIKFILSLVLSIVINSLCFTTLYWVMPSCKVNFINSFIGGGLASLLFEVAKVGFVFYLQIFPSYELIYGALAVLPIFLLWIYISWSIIIFGALVTKALSGK